MDMDVWDEAGRSMPTGKGELVCKSPFPSVPAGFWGDEDGSRFHEAYFDVYPGVWRHGDWMEWTEHGGVVIYGRSDATLNAGGVRIGTAGDLPARGPAPGSHGVHRHRTAVGE